MKFLYYILNYGKNIARIEQLKRNLNVISKTMEGRRFQLTMARAAINDLSRELVSK